ncbi:hypothetical protein BJN34_04730 [Cupriavidus necator]|uniref:Uncharacterized protein n=1 Tax=Cupriavidus necator TaxID=106590 RepID=A0A1U9ULR4_CUPNE|nr:HAD domain-containing protein [Cupriavidus necator]AQV93201.1 hypothetical protein BJN34_04730 [Cupriavidus necator]
MRSVLFLDIDGCAHRESQSRGDREPIQYAEGDRLLEHVRLLADLVAPYPELRIVFTASSVGVDNVGRAKEALPPWLRRSVMGSTHELSYYIDQWDGLSRFDQIVGYARVHEIQSWLALDDDNSSWPDEFQKNHVFLNCHLGLSEQRVREELANKLARLHSQEFQRVTTQHSWTQNMLAANGYIEAAGQAISEARSATEDARRMQAAKTVVLSCSAAMASAQSFRVTKTERNESLLVAFLGNGLEWSREERSAALKLLHYRVEDESKANTAPHEVSEAVSLAEAILQQARSWLANERESHGH